MRYLKYIVLAVFGFIWLSGLNTDVFKLTGEWRRVQSGYQFGDLYRLSNLPQFKDPEKTCPTYHPVVKRTSGRKIHLFILGDSFTEHGRVAKENFDVDTYTYINWGEKLHVKLDTTATNILLIECVERHFREKFASVPGNIVPDTATFADNVPFMTSMQKLDQAFGAAGPEARLDMLLFSNNVALQVKEWKSALNYYLFHRVAKEVTLVNNDQDIVYYMDTDPDTTRSTSSFKPLPGEEIDTLIANLDRTVQFAKQTGFNQVLLSIIPNKVSVLAPNYGVYNKLIQRVYAHPQLKVPFIDVLEDFRLMGRSSYLLGDSHWTCAGQNLWLDKANRLIHDADAKHLR